MIANDIIEDMFRKVSNNLFEEKILRLQSKLINLAFWEK